MALGETVVDEERTSSREHCDCAFGCLCDRCPISEIRTPVVLQELSQPRQRLASVQPLEGAYWQHPSRRIVSICLRDEGPNRTTVPDFGERPRHDVVHVFVIQ